MTVPPQVLEDDRMPLHGADVLPPAEKLQDRYVEMNRQGAGQELACIKAWREDSLLDENGGVWINKNSVRTIIGVKSLSDLAAFRPDPVELRTRDSIEYLRTTRISRFLDLAVNASDSDIVSRRAEISKDIYLSIRDSKLAKDRRNKCYHSLDENRQALKKLRIRKHRLFRDELTGDLLRPKSAEFFYLRHPALYPEFSHKSKFNSGLVVNEATYEEVIKYPHLDERDFFAKCSHKGWKRDWFKNTRFIRELSDEN